MIQLIDDNDFRLPVSELWRHLRFRNVNFLSSADWHGTNGICKRGSISIYIKLNVCLCVCLWPMHAKSTGLILTKLHMLTEHVPGSVPMLKKKNCTSDFRFPNYDLITWFHNVNFSSSADWHGANAICNIMKKIMLQLIDDNDFRLPVSELWRHHLIS